MQQPTKSHFSQIWVVTEGMAGTENPCLGIAEALGVKPVVKRISLKRIYQYLPLSWLPKNRDIFVGDDFFSPWPDMVIASGRKALPFLRYIHAQQPSVFKIFVQHPRISFDVDWVDLFIVPTHDPHDSHPKVITAVGAPTRITNEMLDRARNRWFPLFQDWPKPWHAVLIGGANKYFTVDEIAMRDWLQKLLQHPGSFFITLSRRTPDNVRRIIRDFFPTGRAYLWDGEGENPYMGYLACADTIFVTQDSVSMISEAAGTGKPLYLLPLKGNAGKFARFYDDLAKSGAARFYDGNLNLFGTYKPLREAERIARILLKDAK